jgi:DNA-binding transcriptional ArsR family regulator
MDNYRRQAAILKAIGHPVRLQIVDLLRIEPECVCHLSAALDKPQPYMSQQLAILRGAGVIVDERDGTNIFYRLADDNVARQVAAACSGAAPGNDEPGNKRAGERSGERRALTCCNCPKCSVARGQGVEAFKVAC